MKKTLLFICLSFFTGFLLVGQDRVNLNSKVTVDFNDMPLHEVLNEIGEKAGLFFSLNPGDIPPSAKISYKANKVPVKKILEDLLIPYNLSFTIVEKQIIIKPVAGKEEDKKKAEIPNYTISGYVKDKNDGEILIGATVFVKEIMMGTITNGYGFYSLTLPKGSYKLEYSYLGYQDMSMTFSLGKDSHISAELDPGETVLEEVIVRSIEKEDLVEKLQMSEVHLELKTVNNVPGLLGETDIIKSLQSVPGIKSYGDGSTSFFVRGGNRDQNLVLIDEAPVYNPSHLLGFYSSIIPDMIKDIKIYKGDIPVQYGGRLSSLIDIKTRDGNMKRFNMTGSIGLITNRFSIDGPIKKDKSSYFLSLRSSHLGWLLSKSTDMEVGFYDFNAKINYIGNKNNRFYLSFYSGRDEFGVLDSEKDRFNMGWGNFTGTLRWNHVFGDKLFLNTTLYGSSYDYFLLMAERNDDKNYWKSSIGNFSLKTDFTYYINPTHKMVFGYAWKVHGFNPGNLNEKYGQNSGINIYVPIQQAIEKVLYLSNESKINKRFSIRYGLRFPRWQNIGPTRVYLFDEEHNLDQSYTVEKDVTYNKYANLEPKVSTKYTLDKSSSLKGSVSRNIQHVHLVSNSISPFTTPEVWLPSGPNIKPGKATIFALGYVKNFNSAGFELTIESFYKKLKNQIGYEYQAKMLFNPLLEGELRYGEGRAYGVEFLVKKETGKLDGWIGYTYSRSFKRIEGINFGREYPAYYDRPHDLSLYLSYKPTSRWQLSANWVYATGAAFSSPTGFYYYQGRTVPIYGEKNNDRLPDYHRLDMAAKLQLNKKEKRFSHSLSFGLFNVYGHKNPFKINFNKIQDENGQIVVPSNFYNYPKVINTSISLLGTIPSITYVFKIE
ncbi:MAG: carboxypeptidase-like regulatory domain-containing protein [Bacteroidota bacterium]